MGNKEEIGARIRLYRKSRGLSQAKLAEMIGVKQNTISSYESGERTPDYDTIEALADAFNCRISDLIQEKNGVVSDAEWNPDTMSWAEKEDETTRILARGMSRMTPENRQKLLDMARVMFGQDFDEEGNKK